MHLTTQRRLSPRLIIAITALLCALTAPAAAQQPAQPAPGDEPPTPDTTSPDTPSPAPAQTAPAQLKPEAEEAQGTCETPRQAWLQLLYWLQRSEDRWVPRRAAKCFDVTGLNLTGAEVGRRAERLKRVIDAKNAYIDVDAIPTNPNYVDNQSGANKYVQPDVYERISRDITLIKKDGKWLFSAESVQAIPNLYPGWAEWFEEKLPGFMKYTLAGVELWKYLMLLVVYLIARLIRWLVVLLLSSYLLGVIKRSKLAFLEHVVERAQRPVGVLVMALVFYICIPLLLLPLRFTSMAMVVVEAMAAYACVWLGYRLIDVLTDYMMSKAETTDSKLDDQLIPLVSKVLKVFVSVVGGIFILQNLDVNVGSLIAGLGLGGLAFALAAQDTIANFFGSVMIFIDKPFQIGDWVVIGDTEGVVEEVGFRTSRVRTFYNSLVTVPNAMVTKSVVDNYGARKYRRYVANLGLTYDTPPDKVEAFCEGVRAIITGMPGMRKDYYIVEFKEFADSALIIMVYCFMETPSWNDELRVRTNLNLEIMRFAEKLGVGFAFPTQTLHVNSLPKAGDSWPGHHGPTEHDELKQVIERFGPGGDQARPTGLELTSGYYCGAGPTRGGDEDGG